MSTAAGFDKDPAESQIIWAGNSEKWPAIGPPWRPSPGDAAIYSEIARPKAGGTVLVLGATPELRDLAAGHGARKPVIVDYSLAMLQAMTALTRLAKPEREIWIVADWCEAPLPAGSFDLILGDMIWWAVSVHQQQVLRDRIAELLSPGGVFASRFRFRAPQRIHDSVDDVIASYLARLGDDTGADQKIRDAMLSHVYDITADPALRRMNRERTRAVIAEACTAQSDPRKRSFLEITCSRLIGSDWTSQTREEVLEALSEKFVVATEARADDYDSSYYPILALQKPPSRPEHDPKR